MFVRLMDIICRNFPAVNSVETSRTMATPESESFVRTFARGLKVIEVMGTGASRQTLGEVADGVDLPRTAVRRFLMTLIDLGFVRTDGKQYWLTPRVLRLGMSYLSTLPYWRQAQLALEELCASIKDGALCGLGQTAPNPVLTTIRYFRKEYEAHIREKKCPAHQCAALISYRIDPDVCTGCTLCARNCPVGAISGTVREPHVIDTQKCIKCGVCREKCKFGAIEKK